LTITEAYSALRTTTLDNNTLIRLEEPVYEYTEIGWEGEVQELALFIFIAGCQCHGEESTQPIIDETVNKIGISFRAH
jgi:hypothetical protein